MPPVPAAKKTLSPYPFTKSSSKTQKMVDVYIDTQPAGGEVRKSEKHGKKNVILDNFFVLTTRL